MIRIEWTSTAFAQLESLNPQLSFETIQRVDLLVSFPELGVSLEDAHRSLRSCRQLIVGRHHRVVYEYDRKSEEVWILAVQHCRQRLPSTRELKRRKQAMEESGE
jgi:mRNA-degrading endonuclease RelE of RelBE toxin-antitoxin system